MKIRIPLIAGIGMYNKNQFLIHIITSMLTTFEQQKKQVNQMQNDLDLCDPWKIKRSYTWRQPNSFKQTRLDFFLISLEFLLIVHKVDICWVIERTVP